MHTRREMAVGYKKKESLGSCLSGPGFGLGVVWSALLVWEPRRQVLLLPTAKQPV